jgi:adenylate kinase family enzyme
MKNAEPEPLPPRRIVVLGTSGSGKTTLAKTLSQRLGLRHVELDAIYWQPDWTPTPAPQMRDRVAEATRDGGWAVCGNYRSVRHLTCGAADTVVWLDYPMSRVAWQVTRRTFARWWTGETLWAGNRERLWTQFTSKDSLFLWVINSWRIHRRDYPAFLRELRIAGKRVVRLRSPRDTARWLDSIASLADARAD